jgi:hypothetical protein
MGPNESTPMSAGVAGNTKVLVDPQALPVLQHQTVKTSALRSSLGTERAVSLTGVRCGGLAISCKLAELDDVVEMRERGLPVETQSCREREVSLRSALTLPENLLSGREE